MKDSSSCLAYVPKAMRAFTSDVDSPLTLSSMKLIPESLGEKEEWKRGEDHSWSEKMKEI